MAIFNYVARNKYGEKVQGKVEARSRNQAAAVLTNRELLVINVRPIGDQSFGWLQNVMFGVKADDLVNFTRQLATMINAGLPLATALSILQDQSKAAMSNVVTKLLKDIESGKSLAAALKEFSDIFSRVYIYLVQAGEAGGVLDDVLARLAETLEKQKDFRAKTKGAMIYPVIVMIAMALVAFVMMVFVIPKLTDMYNDFDADLPLATRALIAISSFMAKNWWVIILAAVAGGIGFRSWSKTEPGEKKIDELTMKVPIIGNLRQKLVLTEFARTLSLLLNSGVSLLQALEIVGEAMDSILFRQAVTQASAEVEKGVSLSQALSIYEIFPPILPQMIAVGEETGRIDEILLKLSEYYEKESEYAVKNLTAAMEPLIMIVLGIGVAFMVIAVIMPIYNLTSKF